MKLKITLLISGYCVIITSSLLVSWEHGIGVTALIAALHSIIAMLKKNGKVILLNEASSPNSSKKKSSAKRTSSKKEEISEIAGFNSNVFAKFQSNLQEHQKTSHPEQQTGEASSSKKQPIPSLDNKRVPLPVKSGTSSNKINSLAVSSTPGTKKQNPYEKKKKESSLSFSDTLGMEREDQVKLSKQAKPLQQNRKTNQKNQTSPSLSKKQSPESKAPNQHLQGNATPAGTEKKMKHQEKRTSEQLNRLLETIDEDLFADVQIVLPSEDSLDKSPSHTNTTHDLFDEGLGDVLERYHSPEEKLAEAEALLKMANSSFQAGHALDAKASLDNYFLIQREMRQKIDWEVQYLYAQICLKLGDISTANNYFSKITKDGLTSTHPDYCKILEAMTMSLEEHQMYEATLPLLYDLLNYYRQQLDRAQMDATYERLEKALEELGDDERLIRTFKNHLEIKRILKDRYGESRLLDLIGNRYYKMGEKELSRKYYEDNLHLKALIEKVESP